MTNEFTAHCSYYYQLKMLFLKRQDRLNNLLDNAPFYSGQISLSEIDAIVSYYREAQAAKAKMDKTLADMKEAERDILMFMRHFDIPPGKVLYGEIPGELEYEIWANENDAVFINKIKDLQPEPLDPNIIVIKLWRENEEDL